MSDAPSPSRPDPERMRAEYAARIHRVMDHVEQNLDGELSLATLADVACFSRWHFHRIFAALTGETVGQFVQRLRLERAANALLGNPQLSVTAVALDAGFSSPSTFARAFREHFGHSATAWRAGGCRKLSAQDGKIRKVLRTLGAEASPARFYLSPRTGHPTWEYPMSADEKQLQTTIEVQDQPARTVAYLRHIGPYGQPGVVQELLVRLRRWVSARGLLDHETVTLLVPHDNPNLTPSDKLRLSVCMTVPADTVTEGEVGKMTLPRGLCAVARFDISPAQIGRAWQQVMGEWLPQSGYQPDDRPCYEVVVHASTEAPHGRVVTDLCVPVRPL